MAATSGTPHDHRSRHGKSNCLQRALQRRPRALHRGRRRRHQRLREPPRRHWGRPGATFDAVTGHVYVATGNGHYDASLGGFDWGDSVVALAPDGIALLGDPLDSYTPENYQFLDDDDRDLGSGSLAIVGEVAGYSNGRLGVMVGKDTEVRLLALDDLSGAGGPRHVGGELDMDGDGLVCKCSMPQPAVWTAVDGTKWVYVITEGLRAYEITVVDGQPHLSLQWTNGDLFGVSTWTSSPVIGNGVLYVAGSQLLAIDALSGKTLWASNESQERGMRSSPVVSNGRVYVFASPQTAGEVDVYATDESFRREFSSDVERHSLRGGRAVGREGVRSCACYRGPVEGNSTWL